MHRWVLAAGLIAAAVTSPALAADLDGVPPPPWKGGAYGDPRFPPQGPPPQAYDDDDDADGPPPAKRFSDVPPRYPDAPPRFSDAPPRYAPPPPSRTACVRSEQVRERLTSQGWRDFHDGQAVSQNLVTLRARRPNGRLFELRLDRCSGEVVEVRALELRPFGPYAYRQPYGPWRWGPETAPYSYTVPYAYNGYAAPYAYNGPYANNGQGYERPYGNRWPRRWYGDER